MIWGNSLPSTSGLTVILAPFQRHVGADFHQENNIVLTASRQITKSGRSNHISARLQIPTDLGTFKKIAMAKLKFSFVRTRKKLINEHTLRKSLDAHDIGLQD